MDLLISQKSVKELGYLMNYLNTTPETLTGDDLRQMGAKIQDILENLKEPEKGIFNNQFIKEIAAG